MEKTEILTPVGRLVMGGPMLENKTDAEGQPLLVKTGPDAGKPRSEYFMGLAVPKGPEADALRGQIAKAAAVAFPHLFDAAGNCTLPTFAFKTTDGDSTVPNQKGVRPCDREGFPGHWIFSFSSGYPSKCYTSGGTAIITDPDTIKRGYYIRISGTVCGNGSTQRPGVFLNHNMVELVGYGEEIKTGPDGAAVFGGAPAGALPPGASATPVGATTTPAPAPTPAPTAPTPAPAAVTPPTAPAPDFVAGPPPAPTDTPVMTAAANGVSYEAYKAAGWTHQQMVDAGLVASEMPF